MAGPSIVRGVYDYNRALHCILSLSLSPFSFLSVDDVISMQSQTSSELYSEGEWGWLSVLRTEERVWEVGEN